MHLVTRVHFRSRDKDGDNTIRSVTFFMVHCVQNKTRNEMQCNAMKKLTKESDIGLLVFYEGVMNERFVAVSTVTGSRICGCFSKPRRDFSVTSGWQQMRNAIRWIKQFAEKVLAKFVAPI